MATPIDQRTSQDQFWFKTKIGEPVHTRVVPFGRRLRATYATAHRYLLAYERSYEGSELGRYKGALQTLQERGFSAARLNVSESIIDTVVSRLSKQRPMPSIDVTDALWTTKRKAKQYRKFILGEMLETDFDQLSQEALTDGAVVGHGFTRIDDSGDGKCVFAERVLWDEMLFDPRECKYGQPPNGFRVHRIARDALAEIYPKAAGFIASASPAEARATERPDDEMSTLVDLDDYVDVYEGWHLPRGEADGRHVVCIDNQTLLSEAWETPRFPIATFRYRRPRRGFWSKGLMFKLKDLQHRINCIVRDIQLNLQVTGRGFFMQQEGTALPVEMLSGWAPFSMKYKGSTPPQWNAPTPFNQAQLEALEKFIQYAHDLSGVSMAAASSRSSLGPGASGVALDTQYDIESERFARQEEQYAAYRLEASQLYIDASKRVAKKRAEGKKGKPYVSAWFRRDAIDQLDYDKVSLDDDQYKLKLEAVGFLPSTRSGKLSAVGQLAQAGVIPQWLVAALFDEPDLESSNRITLGAFWNAERKMELLLDESKEMPVPAQYNDLDLELKMTKAYLNWVESEDAPEEIAQRFRDYLGLVTGEQGKAKAAIAASIPPMNGPAALPGAAPMLPPGAPMPLAPPPLAPPIAA